MSQKTATIRGDQLLLALNVVAVSTIPIENWRAHPEWFVDCNHLGLDFLKTQARLREELARYGLPWSSYGLPHSDTMRTRLYPLLRAASGLQTVSFDIDAVIQCFLVPPGCKIWEAGQQQFRSFLMLIASGELTLADFKR